jgi:hypothetical protein
VQDGFQLYLHAFILAKEGQWAVVQQGMNPDARLARRYHWLSTALRSFVDEPHAAVVGENQGLILNLTAHEAEVTRGKLVMIAQAHPDRILAETRRLVMARRHDVRAADVDLKRLAAVLAAAHDRGVQDFAALLLSPGLGPRTLQSLTLISEVIHGTPSRFRDPARFSLAHGGKDGHPFPVPLTVYDESIRTLKDAVGKARIGRADKLQAIRCLDRFVRRAERLEAAVDFDRYLAHERAQSASLGGRSAQGAPTPSSGRPAAPRQLELFTVEPGRGRLK